MENRDSVCLSLQGRRKSCRTPLLSQIALHGEEEDLHSETSSVLVEQGSDQEAVPANRNERSEGISEQKEEMDDPPAQFGF
ncbi:hypothetical protein GOODEAATRI_030382 [Goodea atripinnis]|uniref:Uncharacterized protein n=1 Tax=Goodea atripinnis TaxID=208336 RepID=A0ABV0NEY0_9TELE